MFKCTCIYFKSLILIQSELMNNHINQEKENLTLLIILLFVHFICNELAGAFLK